MLYQQNQLLKEAKSGNSAATEEYFRLYLRLDNIINQFKYSFFLGLTEKYLINSAKKAYYQILSNSSKKKESSPDFNLSYIKQFKKALNSFINSKANTPELREELFTQFINFNLTKAYNPMNAKENIDKLINKMHDLNFLTDNQILYVVQNPKIFALLETIIENRNQIDEKTLEGLFANFSETTSEIAQRMIRVHLEQKRDKKFETLRNLQSKNPVIIEEETETTVKLSKLKKDLLKKKKSIARTTLKTIFIEAIKDGYFAYGEYFPIISEIMITFEMGNIYSELRKVIYELVVEGYLAYEENKLIVTYKQPENSLNLK